VVKGNTDATVIVYGTCQATAAGGANKLTCVEKQEPQPTDDCAAADASVGSKCKLPSSSPGTFVEYGTCQASPTGFSKLTCVKKQEPQPSDDCSAADASVGSKCVLKTDSAATVVLYGTCQFDASGSGAIGGGKLVCQEKQEPQPTGDCSSSDAAVGSKCKLESNTPGTVVEYGTCQATATGFAKLVCVKQQEPEPTEDACAAADASVGTKCVLKNNSDALVVLYGTCQFAEGSATTGKLVCQEKKEPEPTNDCSAADASVGTKCVLKTDSPATVVLYGVCAFDGNSATGIGGGKLVCTKVDTTPPTGGCVKLGAECKLESNDAAGSVTAAVGTCQLADGITTDAKLVCKAKTNVVVPPCGAADAQVGDECKPSATVAGSTNAGTCQKDQDSADASSNGRLVCVVKSPETTPKPTTRNNNNGGTRQTFTGTVKASDSSKSESEISAELARALLDAGIDATVEVKADSDGLYRFTVKTQSNSDAEVDEAKVKSSLESSNSFDEVEVSEEAIVATDPDSSASKATAFIAAIVLIALI